MATLPAIHALDEAPGVVASPERIEAWLEIAEAGDRFVYATRAYLPIGSRGATRMRELAARGFVRLHCPRSALDPAMFNYLAVRTALPLPGAKPIGRPILSAALVDAEAATVDALLPQLERAARFGRPCPTDKQMADRAGLPVEQVELGLVAMRAAGLIRVEAAPSPTRRRVVIVATGERTGLMA